MFLKNGSCFLKSKMWPNSFVKTPVFRWLLTVSTHSWALWVSAVAYGVFFLISFCNALSVLRYMLFGHTGGVQNYTLNFLRLLFHLLGVPWMCLCCACHGLHAEVREKQRRGLPSYHAGSEGSGLQAWYTVGTFTSWVVSQAPEFWFCFGREI